MGAASGWVDTLGLAEDLAPTELQKRLIITTANLEIVLKLERLLQILNKRRSTALKVLHGGRWHRRGVVVLHISTSFSRPQLTGENRKFILNILTIFQVTDRIAPLACVLRHRSINIKRDFKRFSLSWEVRNDKCAMISLSTMREQA